MQTSAEYLLATHNPGGTGSPFGITLSFVIAEAVLPSWPGGVQPSFWAITQLNFQMSKTTSGATTVIGVRLYAADSSGKPTGSPIPQSTGAGQATVSPSNVSTTMGWILNPISVSWTGLEASKKYCLVWYVLSSGVGAYSLGVDTASTDTDFDYSAASNISGPWTLNTARDAFFEITGYYETGAAAVDTYSSPAAVDGLTNPSVTIDVNNKSDRHMTVFLCMRDTDAVPDPNDVVCTGVTCDGVAMTRAADSGWGPGWERVLAYSLSAPNTGTGLTVAATLTGTYWLGEMVAVCSVNVNQTNPVSSTYATDVEASSLSARLYQTIQLGDLTVSGLAWTGVATATPTVPGNLGGPYVNTNNSAVAASLRGTTAAQTIWGMNTAVSLAALSIIVRGLDNADPQPVADYTAFPKFVLQPAFTDTHDNPDDGT